MSIEQARQTPIEDIAIRLGIFLIHDHCPLHEDSTPSFHIYPATNKWHCFGGCGSGDGIALVMRVLDVDFKEAVEWITGDKAIEPRPTPPPRRPSRAKVTPPDPQNYPLWQANLQDTPKALAWLESRGVCSSWADRAGLGYGYVEQLGLEGIIIPTLTGCEVRQSPFNPNPTKPKYKTVGRFVAWGRSSFKNVIIVESKFDALALNTLAEEWVAVALPAGGFKGDRSLALSSYRHLILIPDNESAGGQMEADARGAFRSRVLVKRVPVKYKDLGEFYQACPDEAIRFGIETLSKL
jgi:DNA primase